MTDKDIEKRTNMSRAYMDKKYSMSTRAIISKIFKNCKENKKEELAEKITQIINQSKTEQEALKKIQELAKQG